MNKTQTQNRRALAAARRRSTTVLLVLWDALAVNLAFFLALWLRFDCRFSDIPARYLEAFLRIVPVYTPLCLLVFWRTRLYRSIWRFASYREVERVSAATLVTAGAHILGTALFLRRMPISYYCIGTVLQFFSLLFIRFSFRFVHLLHQRAAHTAARHNVLLIGAGDAGRLILRDLNQGENSEDIIRCVIDDDPQKWGMYLDDVPVAGGREEILSCCRRYRIEKIYLAIPSLPDKEKREILNICKESGCALKILPGIHQLARDLPLSGSLKEVAIEDLLGRDAVRIDMDEVFRSITGKTILVTGAGGSIGSEICRQVASHSPRRLVLFEIYENSAYELQMELRERYPELELVTLIGSVRDSRRLCQVFRLYRPDIVYHAAAHKHVPLMEDSPCEAVKNNVFGTYKTAWAAARYGCGRFVLISTDKAVNPTNMMGASKRLCEMVVQAFDRRLRQSGAESLPALCSHPDAEPGPARAPEGRTTEFVAVRFGNVLGSNGSVVPIFQRQIAAGGPVTVTHPDVIRYFMTVPEAVSLVLQAGCYARGGEIFVLDMGSPVRIDTLARNLIRLSGLEPDVDIPISYTGLRPGEKLYEEKLMAEEGMKRTANELIYIGSPLPFDVDRFFDKLPALLAAAMENSDSVQQAVAELVDTYHPVGSHGQTEKDEGYARLAGSVTG